MSEFYTNVSLSKGKILLRGILDGKPFKQSIPYKPTHYVKAKSKSANYQTLDGRLLDRIDFNSTWDARNFIDKYEGVANFDIYGSKKYEYRFIYDNYRDMEWETKQIRVLFYDIETAGNPYETVHPVKVRHGDRVEETTVGMILREYEGWEVLNEETESWEPTKNCVYVAPTGFPVPELANNPITAISMRMNDKTVVLGTVDYTPHRDGLEYIKCRDERELLWKFIDAWRSFDPDIISGWNIERFDNVYVYNRIVKVLGEEAVRQLSPWGLIKEYTTKSKFGQEAIGYEFVGISTIDLMEAYVKFSFKNQESYSLNNIASVELGEKKIDYSQYENIFDLYLRDPQLFIEYNIQDTDLVLRINEKTGLIEQIITLAFDAKVNLRDAFGSVLFWETIIQNYLLDKGIVTPTNRKRAVKERQNVGAFVKQPQPKKVKWVAGLDLDSLYPHLIMGYNISPETMVKCIPDLRLQMPIEDILEGKLKDIPIIKRMIEEEDCAYTPNGAFFRRDIRGFLPALMDSMYTDRKRYKKMMLDAKKEYEETHSKEAEALVSKYNNLQLAKKTALNSAYGALSNMWFEWFEMDLAEAITFMGQLAIKWVSQELNEYFNTLLGTTAVDFILANDTDSAYLDLSYLVDKVMPGEKDKRKIVNFLVKVCEEKVNPLIASIYERLRSYTNGYEQKMSMKLESISDVGFWKAKKHYALRVWWDEGVVYHEPKLKIKGLAAVQMSTPAICRDAMKKAIEIFLNDDRDGFYDYVDEFEKKFRTMPYEEVAGGSKVTDIEKYYDPDSIYSKGAQSHIRGSLIYNDALKKNNLDKLYQRIRSGDKIKVCYLKLPNPIRDDVISTYNKLPPELGLQAYIDYDRQFEKEFLKPMNDIAKLDGWDLNNRNTLAAFFT